MSTTQILLIIYLVVLNVLGLAAMAADKIRAVEHRFRIPEATLLTIAVIGGSLGCLVGMFLFRHKTRKPKFRIGLPAILAAQVLLCVLLHLFTSSIVFI